MIAATRENLFKLSWIRLVVLTGQILATLYFTLVTPIGLPTAPLTVLLICYGFVALAGYWRARSQLSVSDTEFAIHLLADILFFSGLLYYSAGASNPFVSYLLIPVSIAALTLSRVPTLLLSAAAISAYTLLFRFNIPVEAISPSHHHGGNNLHLIGMWLNFIVSTVIVVYFISQMANALRKRDEELASQREENLRNEQLLAVATLAAGTAHEMGTPLNTMKLIIDDLPVTGNDAAQDVDVLRQQIAQCQQILRKLVSTAEQAELGVPVEVSIGKYFAAIFDRWLLLHPGLSATIHLAPDLPAEPFSFPPTIAQSVMNLLNNAAEASPQRVEVRLQVNINTRTVSLDIKDYGGGLSDGEMSQLGEPFHSTKETGMGLGLFLSQASLSRYGGAVTLTNHSQGGLLTHIELPLLPAA
ncbi:MAG: HAMP domain-containing histidine kinase [Pseudomonadales bacterium]|nr:HAMP domain-containing histidine kinase [Pseudomonadales bacterium]